MSATVTDNLTRYIKQVSSLETSVYRQSEVIKAIKENNTERKITRTYIAKPTKEEVVKPVEPVIDLQKIENQDKKALTDAKISKVVGIVFGAFCILIVLIFLKTAINDSEGKALAALLLGLGAGFVYWGAKSNVKEKDILKYIETQKAAALKAYNDQMDVYRDAYMQYEEDLKASEISFSDKMKQYEEDCAYEENQYNKRVEVSAANRQQINDQLEVLYRSLEQTKKALNELYDLDIVFPKYRNMIAMTTIYEYLASGRCASLSGADGAYNLYEFELRQNIVINRLDKIVSQLDQIKNNQYLLYEEMVKTNRELSKVKTFTRAIASQTERIANASEFTAYTSAVSAAANVLIAENTSAIASATKYIALKQ